jgi:RimJ/RimL family protein N-acetyltransferase
MGGGLVLRPFVDADAAAFAQAVRESVQTVGRWLPWCTAGYTDVDALTWFGVCRESLDTGMAYEFGVFDAQSGELLGGAGLNQINHLHQMCNLGYWVRQSHQRQGIAPRCVQVLLSQAFAELGLRRVEIVVAVGNVPSEAVARRSGAHHECVARNRLCIRGVSVPAHVFSHVPPAAREADQPSESISSM